MMPNIEDEMHPDAPDDIRLSRFGALRGCLFGLLLLAGFALVLWAACGR